MTEFTNRTGINAAIEGYNRNMCSVQWSETSSQHKALHGMLSQAMLGEHNVIESV